MNMVPKSSYLSQSETKDLGPNDPHLFFRNFSGSLRPRTNSLFDFVSKYHMTTHSTVDYRLRIFPNCTKLESRNFMWCRRKQYTIKCYDNFLWTYFPARKFPSKKKWKTFFLVCAHLSSLSFPLFFGTHTKIEVSTRLHIWILI